MTAGITDQLVDAWNSADVDRIADLYADDAGARRMAGTDSHGPMSRA